MLFKRSRAHAHHQLLVVLRGMRDRSARTHPYFASSRQLQHSPTRSGGHRRPGRHTISHQQHASRGPRTHRKHRWMAFLRSTELQARFGRRGRIFLGRHETNRQAIAARVPGVVDRFQQIDDYARDRRRPPSLVVPDPSNPAGDLNRCCSDVPDSPGSITRRCGPSIFCIVASLDGSRQSPALARHFLRRSEHCEQTRPKAASRKEATEPLREGRMTPTQAQQVGKTWQESTSGTGSTRPT